MPERNWRKWEKHQINPDNKFTTAAENIKRVDFDFFF